MKVTVAPTGSEEDSVENDRDMAERGSSDSAHNYYKGGLGLVFHQQSMRASGGESFGFVSASGGSNQSSSYSSTINGNVNLLLGGAMLSLITTILCVVCYCCHRNIRKRTETVYRQQRQWLENDSNMEIYSVEQFYETTGLFLGDSTNGLSALPMLQHEPPPTYDAVVAMQEQQEQLQCVTQRNSPPPEYHSSINVNVPGASASATASHVQYPPDNCNSHRRLYQLDTKNTCMMGNSLLAFKKVWDTQSCCSLQRAEVENMWNAATAAVATRNRHGRTVNAHHNDQPMVTAVAVPSRRSSDKIPGTGLSRQYLNQQYRLGCPLCGKFRNDATDDTLSITSEIVLDNAVLADENSEEGAIGLQSNPESSTSLKQDEENFYALSAQDDDNCSCSLQPRRNTNPSESPTQMCEISGNHTEKSENNNGISNNFTTTQLTCSDREANCGDLNANDAVISTLDTTENSSDLDAINGNGIVRLDMSKIIDKTGLPTYDAALKLDSSGYV